MGKRKNYTTLFLAKCRKHEVWFSVCVDSGIDTITYLKDDAMIDVQPGKHYKLGTKGAYDWLVQEIKEIEDDIKDGIV